MATSTGPGAQRASAGGDGRTDGGRAPDRVPPPGGATDSAAAPPGGVSPPAGAPQGRVSAPAGAPQGRVGPFAAAGGAGSPAPAHDDESFSATVAAVTSAFGDPTRRQIYLYCREQPGGVTAAEVARRFALHANVARHHLDKLSAGGYLEVFVLRTTGGGAGRPSKRYRSTARDSGLPSPRRGDDLLIMLLGEALSRLPREEAEMLAESVGEEYGRRLADQISPGDGHGHRSFRAALHAIADALTAHGFEAHAQARGGSLALIKDACPFFDTARQHPVICAVDRGMVRGMLAGLYGGDTSFASQSSRALGDDACVSIV